MRSASSALFAGDLADAAGVRAVGYRRAAASQPVRQEPRSTTTLPEPDRSPAKPRFSPQVVQQIGQRTPCHLRMRTRRTRPSSNCASMGQTAATPGLLQAVAHGPRYHVFRAQKRRCCITWRPTSTRRRATWELWRRHSGTMSGTLRATSGTRSQANSHRRALHDRCGQRPSSSSFWIGETLVKLAEWVIDTVEAGLQAITAIFNWIKATIEEVIDSQGAVRLPGHLAHQRGAGQPASRGARHRRPGGEQPQPACAGLHRTSPKRRCTRSSTR